MDFQGFLDMLPSLASLIFPGQRDPKIATQHLLEEFFIPKFEAIMSESYVGSINEIVKSEIFVGELTELYKVITVLLKIYQQAFQSEFFKENDYNSLRLLHKLSQKEYFKYCSDYGLFPDYITKGMAISLWNEIIGVDIDWLHHELVIIKYWLNIGRRSRL